MEIGQGDPQHNEFSEYMWMADLEKFDKEMTCKILEEDYIRSSIEMLLEEEERETHYFDESGNEYQVQNQQEQFFNAPTSTNGINPPMQYYGPMGNNNASINHAMENLGLTQRFPFQQIPQSRYSYPPMQGFPSVANSRAQPESQHNGNNMHYNYNMTYTQGIPSTSVSNPTTVLNSKLNPNAKPFFLNPEAEEFVPQFSKHG